MTKRRAIIACSVSIALVLPLLVASSARAERRFSYAPKLHHEVVASRARTVRRLANGKFEVGIEVWHGRRGGSQIRHHEVVAPNQEFLLGSNVEQGISHYYKVDRLGRVTRRYYVAGRNPRQLVSQLKPQIDIVNHDPAGSFVEVEGKFRGGGALIHRRDVQRGTPSAPNAETRGMVISRKNGSRTLVDVWQDYLQPARMEAKGVHRFKARVRAEGQSVVDLGRFGFEHERVRMHFQDSNLAGMSVILESKQLPEPSDGE